MKRLDDRPRVDAVPLYHLPSGHMDSDCMARCWRDGVTG
jgi:hypothetical protein